MAHAIRSCTRIMGWMLFLVPLVRAAGPPSAASIAAALHELSLDSTRTYRVRDLQLTRGDIKLYLSEGILSFVTPVAGQTMSAVFSTQNVEGGDGEIIVLPPRRSERASLAAFTKSPNLDEHFSSALLIFTDGTMQELMTQIEDRPIHEASADAATLSADWNPIVRNINSGLSLHLAESLLDNHKPGEGFFHTLIAGRTLGTFDVTYQPRDIEPISIGQLVSAANRGLKFQLWTSFRPRRVPAYVSSLPVVSDYRIETTIRPDLTLASAARFQVKPSEDTRALVFNLSSKLRVTQAAIDGQPMEVYQPLSAGTSDAEEMTEFLLVSETPLAANRQYGVDVHYEGSVIRRTPDGAYFVGERNAWFPFTGPTLAMFDMTFRCPSHLKLVSTGEPISDEISGDTRIVHRKTAVPERFAGFNVGDYDVVTGEQGRYQVECYSNRPAIDSLEKSRIAGSLLLQSAGRPEELTNSILAETRKLLDEYTEVWGSLPIHDLVVSPIPGYFGQGFPGLIYLSTVAYLREEDRPTNLRDQVTDTFFSEMLLPHETAHQWWGNIVTAADYRAEWLMEAMANDTALEVLNARKGRPAVEQILAHYRDDLLEQRNGNRLEQAGPVDFGIRLSHTWDQRTWQIITYEKGAWILRMLRQRLGDEGFKKMQIRLLHDFANKPITNEDFRKVASEFVPPGQPDRSLELFFETWVYGTGIPVMKLNRSGLDWTVSVTGVDDDFSIDVPVDCKLKTGNAETRWVRVLSGSNSLDLPPNTGACRLPGDSDFLYLHQ